MYLLKEGVKRIMLLGFGFMIMFLIMAFPIIDKTNWNSIKSIVICMFIVGGMGILMLGSLYVLRFGI